MGESRGGQVSRPSNWRSLRSSSTRARVPTMSPGVACLRSFAGLPTPELEGHTGPPPTPPGSRYETRGLLAGAPRLNPKPLARARARTEEVGLDGQPTPAGRVSRAGVCWPTHVT